ncbi:hypothetical protein B296_00053971 [Ensete ventricosum]|uniref:Uncharacterized protein n=1 Tax=Ensete ventricosum TaxID=4639 RepID=A0A426XK87_ENSVE|nr:hypothetical protein B296_00053971 [Ensete ventricosum]
MLGRTSPYTIQIPEPPRSIGSAPTPFRFPSHHARSDQLLHHTSSRAPARSDQFSSSCSIGSAPAPICSRAPARSDQFSSSRSDQFPNPCSTRSIPELLLGRISSRSDQFRALAWPDQFLSPGSVRSTPGYEARLAPHPSSPRSDQFLSPRSG